MKSNVLAQRLNFMAGKHIYKTKLYLNVENGFGLVLGSRILRETILKAKNPGAKALILDSLLADVHLTLWKKNNFNRRTVINMFKHISNGTNLKFLLFIQSVCRNFKIYSHILFLR